MKVLVDRIATSDALPFILDELKHYLRLPPDLGDIDDAELTRLARAAALEVEQFSQVALLSQTIRVTLLDHALGQYDRASNRPYSRWGIRHRDVGRPAIHIIRSCHRLASLPGLGCVLSRQNFFALSDRVPGRLRR